MNTWFLIHCKPKQEIRAEENLIRQGFEVFRPVISVLKSKIGCKSYVVQESLFPRYLFVRIDPQIRSISPVYSTFGVANFVKFGERYATMSDTLIEEIKVNVKNQAMLAGSPEAIKKGDEIYVNGHGFDQMKAIYCNPHGKLRVIILMNILGKETRLTVPLAYISKAET